MRMNNLLRKSAHTIPTTITTSMIETGRKLYRSFSLLLFSLTLILGTRKHLA